MFMVKKAASLVLLLLSGGRTGESTQRVMALGLVFGILGCVPGGAQAVQMEPQAPPFPNSITQSSMMDAA